MKNLNFFRLISVAALSLALIVNAACSQQTTQARVVSSPSEGDGGGGGGNIPSLPTVLEDKFKVYTSFSLSSVKSYLHDMTSADWSKSCEVAPNATTDAEKYLDCIMEVHELDLFFSELTLGFNVPAKMCHYVRVKPYWYWRGKAGIGPTAVSVTKNGTAPAVITSQTAHAQHPTITAGYSNGQLKCSADYTGKLGAPNCCEGTYTLTTTTIESGVTTVSTDTGSWGGLIGNCAQGAADQMTEREPTHGMPINQIYSAYIGITGNNSASKLTPPISTPTEDIIHVANFYDETLYSPPSVESVVLLSPTSGFIPSRYYEYTCYDEAWEALARIRLQIRRWTTIEQLAIRGDWNKAGNEPNPTYPDTNGDLSDKRSWETTPFSNTLLTW